MKRRTFVKSVAALAGYPFICKATDKITPMIAHQEGYNDLGSMCCQGFPYKVPKKEQHILYNLPEEVKSYVIIAEVNCVLQAYLIYDNKIELINVLGNEKQSDGNYTPATKLFAAEFGESPQIVKVLNFSTASAFNEIIGILRGVNDTKKLNVYADTE